MLEDSLIERMDAYRVLLLWQKEGTFIKESGLSPFAMELALGVCRRHLYLQYFIKSLVKKKPSLEVCTILEMGLFQMFFMEVPDHAAVSTSVELSKAANLQEGSARLVNAVLHAARRSGLPQLPPQRVCRVSVENSVPESLVRRWFDIYGADRAEALAKATLERPSEWLRVNLQKTTVESLVTKLFVTLEGCNPDRVQEALASESSKRSDLIPQSTEGATSNLFDRILLDVPCSNMGVIARRPESKYRITPESVKELAELQSKLLASASQALKVGGILVYATCSPDPMETTQVVNRFVKEHPEFEKVGEPVYPGVEDSRFDGFFAQALRRKG